MNTEPYNDAEALTSYIIGNYGGFMTTIERSAQLHLLREAKRRNSTHKEQLEEHDFRLYGPLSKEARALLADGPELFFERIRNRILAEHADDIVLNRCEKCGCLCRTPKACLCPVCNHTWYERRKER